MLLRMRMKREEATMAGLAVGRARRRPNASEVATWYRHNGLRAAFERGRRRGRRQVTRLEQLRLEGVA